jgi:hypothetical protein
MLILTVDPTTKTSHITTITHWAKRLVSKQHVKWTDNNMQEDNLLIITRDIS